MRRPANIALAFLLCLAAALAGCAGNLVEPALLEPPPQDASLFLQPPWRIPAQTSRDLFREFRQKYFACWDAPRAQEGLVALREEYARLRAEPGLGQNLLPLASAWFAGLEQKAGLASYPNAGWPGLTLGWADLRVVNTDRPSLEQARRPGALAFDRLQQSLLPPNLPLYVHHQSRDRAWLWVQTPVAWGWLPARLVARLGPEQARRWQGGKLFAVLRENVPLYDPGGRFLFKLRIGCLLPQGPGGRPLAAVADETGRAVLLPANAASGALTAMPLEFDSAHLARLINRLLGLPYGWGGQFRSRDCSATLKDMFTPFGLWLPRNSRDQAHSGRFLNLAGLGQKQKEALILRQGKPGLSLLWLPGHIMLYLGSWQGRAVAFHNSWGLKTRVGLGQEGRAIIGRAMITSLAPGRDMPGLDRAGGLLIQKLEGLSILLPALGSRPCQ